MPAADDTHLAPLFTWRSAICDSELAPTSRHVALALSLYMNERGSSAFPGAVRLAHDTGLSERSVRDHLNLLVAGGWLALLRRGGAEGTRRHANEYGASIPNQCAPAACDVVDEPVSTPEPAAGVEVLAPPTTPEPAAGVTPLTPEPPAGVPLQEVPSTPAGGSPQLFRDLSKDLSTTIAPTASTPARARPRDEIFDAVVDACGIEPATLTAAARGPLNRAVKELKAVGATPADVSDRASVFVERYPSLTLTPPALAKHWPQLTHRAQAQPVAQPKGFAAIERVLSRRGGAS